MSDEQYNIFRSTVHWRYAMARPNLTIFDARLIFFVALFLFHIRWWTFMLLIGALTVFFVANQMNYSIESISRLIRSRLIGNRRTAIVYTRLRPMMDYSSIETSGHNITKIGKLDDS